VERKGRAPSVEGDTNNLKIAKRIKNFKQKGEGKFVPVLNKVASHEYVSSAYLSTTPLRRIYDLINTKTRRRIEGSGGIATRILNLSCRRM
jgi:hypothetical protein